MIKVKNKIYKLAIIFAILIAVLVGWFALFNKKDNYQNYQQQSGGNYINYTSQDLKISFQYPGNWYVDNQDYTILLTNYETSLNRDDEPYENQIEIIVRNFNAGCKASIEENLIDPACGEGGPGKTNKILSKDSRETNAGAFYKYVVYSPNDVNLIYYLLQDKNDSNKIIQISKSPDPSQFEKEFNNIIESIKFL